MNELKEFSSYFLNMRYSLKAAAQPYGTAVSIRMYGMGHLKFFCCIVALILFLIGASRSYAMSGKQHAEQWNEAFGILDIG